MLIQTQAQVDDLRQSILLNAEKAREVLDSCLTELDALQLFATIKFERLGFDPISGQKSNLIEQINQMFSDLVVLAAVQYLLTRYPKKEFHLHLGPITGYDIESSDGQVVAECFAVTNISSNNKFHHDCQKLLKSSAENKHLFFYTYRDSETALQHGISKYPEIHFDRIHYLIP